MELLPNLGGLTSTAHAVSADGTLTVGCADDERGYPRAALWIEDGSGFFPTPFPIFSEAYAIDPDATHFAGYAYNRSYTQAACLWDGGIYYQSQGQSLQLPPSLRFPPLREGNRWGVVPPVNRGNLKEGVKQRHRCQEPLHRR